MDSYPLLPLKYGYSQLVDAGDEELASAVCDDDGDSRLIVDERVLILLQSSLENRNLLRKYIAHVRECEGVSFLRDHDRTAGLSDQEWEALCKLDRGVTG